MKVGSFPAFRGRSPPIGTPFSAPGRHPIFLVEDVRAEIPSAEESVLTLMRTPLEPKVSLRCHGGEDGFARVLFSAHTAPRPAVLSRPIFAPVNLFAQPDLGRGIHESHGPQNNQFDCNRQPCCNESLAPTTPHLGGVVSATVLHCHAVLPGFTNVAAVDLWSAFRPTENVGQYFVVGELIVG